ncbi:MAG: hypothetical protein CL808_05085 [Citromicrobium sp.]|nr:hypothetical protein [Citromicrobium sp.]
MTEPASPSVETEPLALTGPVEWPEKGTLPLRRDLAHIALAPRFLVANYAQPSVMHIGSEPAPLVRSTKDESDVIATLPAGSPFEALDVTTTWVWGCIGPEGPSGYVRRSAFA